ncbi:CHAT domain-containing protein [Ancylothrix sp. C2]|uniref:CHAT domain-containing protein n=1 Tax=Ancylothrix sp. D3o TaxID=2953691 RepID=UPI0021BB5504|nr:CHAT domain-containing protein [Ancylothrix sp. D3o]MCT7951689.1 CHAT domain-containing protein [Ancylothrix sp. D3o]
MNSLDTVVIALTCGAFIAGAGTFASPILAQPITPSPDGTGTLVTPQNNQFNITGGSLSGDGANLFHSFTQFNLSPGQIANFISNPNILNILGRINGGNASYINGLIQITGGNSNLFLMNPAGIMFGSNASLNVPASFTVTTATGMGFNNGFFNAFGGNNYGALVGTPSAFNFAVSQPGSIVNTGNLSLRPENNLTLIGGNVINTGILSSPGGNISLTAVPGNNSVRISQQGRILNLEIVPNSGLVPAPITPLSLPQLLTGSNAVNSATGLIVNENGDVILTQKNIVIPANSPINIAPGNLNVLSENGNGNVNILGNNVEQINAQQAGETPPPSNVTRTSATGNIILEVANPNNNINSGGTLPAPTRETNIAIQTSNPLNSAGNIAARNVSPARGNILTIESQTNPGNNIINQGGNFQSAVNTNPGNILINQGGNVPPAANGNPGNIGINQPGNIPNPANGNPGNIVINQGGNVSVRAINSQNQMGVRVPANSPNEPQPRNPNNNSNNNSNNNQAGERVSQPDRNGEQKPAEPIDKNRIAGLANLPSNPPPGAGINLRDAINTIERNRSQEYNNFFGNKADFKMMSVENLRDALTKILEETGNRTAIIYVTALPNELELILYTPEGEPVRLTVPDAGKEILLQTASKFTQSLTNVVKRNNTNYLESSQKLYQWIIAPLEADLIKAKINTLLFSMDSGLRTLPVAALHDGKQFLVEKYSLGLVPSISLMDARYQNIQKSPVLAMGASEFRELNALPAVPLELKTITAEQGGEAFLNENFTRDNIVNQRQNNDYKIVHLATHAEFTSGDADNSYIQFWNEKLGFNEIRSLRLNQPPVELLVLSACKTAVGDEKAELGFAGLAVGSGVKSALASLWYVSDEGTLGLMSEFYKELENVPIKAEALRQAQLAMLRGEVRIENGELRGTNSRGAIVLPAGLAKQQNLNLSHPYFWSGFTMIGSPW